MQNERDSIGGIIRRAREAKNWTQTQLAEVVGTRQQTIEKIEAGKISHSRYFPLIASQLNLPLATLVPGAVEVQGAASRAPMQVVPASDVRMGHRDLPVHVAAEGGRGEMIVSTEPVDWVARPAPLANVVEAYGIIVIGESMVPEFEPGDIALIHPHLPPTRNVTCVFYSHVHGETRATIKRLIRFTEKVWFVRQWNPGKGQRAEFQLLRTEWAKCHRVVGRYNSR